MYDEHYGLTGRPFQLTPDPKFWFETATHRKAMAYLGYGIAQGEGFIVITGDIGAGKTTLVGHLMDTIDHQRLNAIHLVSTAIEADDLLRIVATALGVDPAGLEKAQLLIAIERGLHGVARTAKRTLLIVDEAQALPVSALEELRMLSNFQAGGHALLQILLLGQPEFRDRLHGSDRLEQLRQRVIAIHHLDPMEEDEVADYIAHRLSVVGWTGNPDFRDDAFPALYHGSGGVPRRLNLLAGRVMLYAAIENLTLIDADVVHMVLRDLDADLPMLALDTPAASEAIAEPIPIAVEQAEPELGASRWLQTDPVDVTAETVTAKGDAPAAEREDTALAARVTELEARVEQQDEALRRVLTLLVDWVESDAPKPEYAPIRGVANWHDAA